MVRPLMSRLPQPKGAKSEEEIAGNYFFTYSQYFSSWPFEMTRLERIYKRNYDYQNFSPLANGTDLNRQKYAILQTH